MTKLQKVADEQTNYSNAQTQRRIMLQYLQLMIAREDWHGVADAAMDLREMDAESRRKSDE